MRIPDEERRRRLVDRHLLGGTGVAGSPESLVERLVALHSSDPLTPHLAARARLPGFTTSDLERALYEARTLWRMHAMRRTLFVVSLADAPTVEAAAAREVAGRERRRLEGWLAAEPGIDEPSVWLDRVGADTRALMSDGVERTTREVIQALPDLGREITVGSGRWATRVQTASRVLTVLAMEGDLVRTRPVGSWRSSRYRWAAAPTWFGRRQPRLDPSEARVALTGRYLSSHGPATEQDLRWWTGWPVGQVRGALRELGAVAVELDSGGSGWVLGDDLDPAPSSSRRVALLPGLDPTLMGWKEREWFLGRQPARLFDGNGNAGPTVWVDGRAVGAWGQRQDGTVVAHLLEVVDASASDQVEAEASSLTVWLDGEVAVPRFRTPLERALSSGAAPTARG